MSDLRLVERTKRQQEMAAKRERAQQRREARTIQRLQEEELARMMGVTRRTIRRWIRDGLAVDKVTAR